VVQKTALQVTADVTEAEPTTTMGRKGADVMPFRVLFLASALAAGTCMMLLITRTRQDAISGPPSSKALVKRAANESAALQLPLKLMKLPARQISAHTHKYGAGGEALGAVLSTTTQPLQRQQHSCDLRFQRYVPSKWEAKWFEQRAALAGCICKTMVEQQDLTGRWMRSLQPLLAAPSGTDEAVLLTGPYEP